MTVKASDITALVELFASSQWDELHVEIDGVQLFLSKDPNARLTTGAAVKTLDDEAVGRPAPAITPPTGAAGVAQHAATRAPASDSHHSRGARDGEVAVPDSWIAVTAPNLGTFYRAPKPGAAPFVEEGQSVLAGAELCLLEVMKLFTAVKAGEAGIVRRICVKDGEMVEFGQTLFYIERI